MTRKRKLIVYGLLTAAGLLFALTAGAVLFLRSGYFREMVRARIVTTVEEVTGGKVELGSFHVDWPTLEAEARGFTLHGKEAEGEAPLFHASRIAVGISVFPRGPRKVVLRWLTVEQPRFHLIVYPDGSNNFPTPRRVRQPQRHPVERLVELAIGRLTVTKGVFSIAELEVPLFADGQDFHAVLDHDLAGRRYLGDSSWRNLELKIGELSPVRLDGSGAVSLEANGLEVTSLKLSGRRSALETSLRLRDFSHPELDIHFAGVVAVEEAPLPRGLALLRRGTVQVSGNAKRVPGEPFALTAAFRAAELAYRDQWLNASRLSARGELRLHNGGVRIPGAVIAGLGGEFRGAVESSDLLSWRLTGEVKSVDLNQIAAATKTELPFTYSGSFSGPVSAGWRIRGGRAEELNARAHLQVSGESADVRAPLEGHLDVSYASQPGRLRFGRSYLRTPTLHALFEGDLNGSLPFELEVLDVRRALEEFPAVARAIKDYPVEFHRSRLEAKGALGQALSSPVVVARTSVSDASLSGIAVERASAMVTWSRASFLVRSLELRGPAITVSGDLEARGGGEKLDQQAVLSGGFTVRKANLGSLAKSLEMDLPVEGSLDGEVILGGTLAAPLAVVSLRAPRLVYAGERGDNFQARLTVTESRLTVQEARVDLGGGRLHSEGSYAASDGKWDRGQFAGAITFSKIRISRLTGGWKAPQGVDAVLDGQVRSSFAIRPATKGDRPMARVDLAALDGVMSVSSLQLEQIALGSARLTAVTRNRELRLNTLADIAQTQVRGFANVELRDGYPIRGVLSAAEIRLASLQPFLTDGQEPLPVTGVFGGAFTFAGAASDFSTWRGQLVLPEANFELRDPKPVQSRTEPLAFRNESPIQFRFADRTLRVEQAKITGPGASLELTGTAGLASGGPLALRFRGKVDLQLAERWVKSIVAEGVSDLDATIRGTWSKPQFQGKLQLANASVYLRDGPMGVEQAQGLIRFDSRRATIEKFTARAGGGDLTIGGFLQFGDEDVLYRLQMNGKGVRVRYPEGVSSTSSATLTFSGTSRSSVLAGDVVVERASINPRLDIGALLAQANKTPASLPSSDLLRGMRLAVNIKLAPDAQIQTSLTRDIEAQADLTLRGSAANMVLLGRISVTEGEINFFSNRYTINRGEVTFENPARNEAVLDLDLQTRTRGVEVNLTFAGTINKLNVSYRSDPPLPLSEILSLLATGRNPNTDPQYLARQSQVSQSWQQIGGNALVAQALTAPVTNRIERLFGISRIRIDPQVTGLDSQPQARVVVEQQITRDVVLIYSTNLVGTQNQAVRVEWDFNQNWSATGGRDEFGVQSVDFFYRKRF